MRWSLWFFLLCGGFAGMVLAEQMVPSGLRDLEVHDQEFRLTRPDADPVEVTEARWFFLPWLFADFDLQMDIEVSEGAEVDLLLRQVEPRLVKEVIFPFAGRFTALRLSTAGEGVGWRSREQALFGPSGNGVGLAPGYAATVWVQGRGRMLRANVAGKWQPWYPAEDTYGMFAVIAKGGKAVLHNFVVTPRGERRWLWSPWTWALLGVLGAAVVLAFVLSLAEGRSSLVVAGLVLILLARWLGRQADLDLAWPDPGVMLLALAACLLVSIVLLLQQVRGLVLIVLLAVAVVLGEAVIGSVRHDTSQVDTVFGPDAGNQISEAHAQLVRGPAGLHDVGREGPCVFLLGGKVVYDRATPAEHLELLVGRELRGALLKQVDVPCLPTDDGYPPQQWRMFEQFFTGYRPAVIVLGVGVEPADGVRYTVEELVATVRAAQQHCEQNEARLVLFADADIAAPMMSELQQLAGGELPLVLRQPAESPAEVAKNLAAAILPLLR